LDNTNSLCSSFTREFLPDAASKNFALCDRPGFATAMSLPAKQKQKTSAEENVFVKQQRGRGKQEAKNNVAKERVARRLDAHTILPTRVHYGHV
jgi:hypothetical protein